MSAERVYRRDAAEDTARAQRRPARIVPLLAGRGIEAHGGAVFDAKGRPILLSANVTDRRTESSVTASEALLNRAAPHVLGQP